MQEFVGNKRTTASNRSDKLIYVTRHPLILFMQHLRETVMLIVVITLWITCLSNNEAAVDIGQFRTVIPEWPRNRTRRRHEYYMMYARVSYKIPPVKGTDSQYNEFLYILKETNGRCKRKWKLPQYNIYLDLLRCSSQVFWITGWLQNTVKQSAYQFLQHTCLPRSHLWGKVRICCATHS